MMNELLFWSLAIYAAFQIISSVGNIFSEKELIIGTKMRKINALIGLYLVIIIVLFLYGVLK